MYDANVSLDVNIKRFRKIYTLNESKWANIAPSEIQRAEEIVRVFNWFTANMKKAKDSGNPIAIKKATEDMELILKDPAAGIRLTETEKFRNGHAAPKPANSAEPVKDPGQVNAEKFLTNMFMKYFDELSFQFSPLKHIE